MLVKDKFVKIQSLNKTLQEALADGDFGFKNNFTSTVNPTVNDDVDLGYSSGSLWINRTTNVLYHCTSNTNGAAVWVPLNLPRNKNISALNIDWNDGEIFYKDISADSTFTFSNLQNGKTIIVIINNTDTLSHTVAFPTTLARNDIVLSVLNGKENVYTFVRSNGKTYVTSVSELE